MIRLENKIKKKPKIKIYFVYGLVPDIIPLLFPNLDDVIKIHLFFLFPAISLIIYFLQLEFYGRWSEDYINQITDKHKTLKKEYKKQNVYLTKHENISSRFIDQLSFLAINSKYKYITSKILESYQCIKQDELSKYNRKDEN